MDWVPTSRSRPAARSSVKEAGTSDEMVQLMRTGQYDGVSASGNAIAAPGRTAATSTRSTSTWCPNYKTVFSDLKDQPYNTFDGVHYGIPHGRGANLLMWNTERRQARRRSPGRSILDPKQAAKYKGKI